MPVWLDDANIFYEKTNKKKPPKMQKIVIFHITIFWGMVFF